MDALQVKFPICRGTRSFIAVFATTWTFHRGLVKCLISFTVIDVSHRPSSDLEDRPRYAVRNSFFRSFGSNSPYLEAVLDFNPWRNVMTRGPLNVDYRETQNVPIPEVFTIIYRFIIVTNLYVPAVFTLHSNKFKQALNSDPWSSIIFFTCISHLHFTLLNLLPLLSFFTFPSDNFISSLDFCLLTNILFWILYFLFCTL
jgi:hypothetical protein